MSVTYAAVLPVRDETVDFLAGLLAAERLRPGTRADTRALSVRDQAVLVLRWFLDGTRMSQLSRDNAIGKSTGYDYLHEGIDVLTARAPSLHGALLAAKAGRAAARRATNHLDTAGIDWLGDYLADFPGALLVVTHDRAFLDRVAGAIVELDGIHEEPQCYTGNYTAYRIEKQRRWERLLLDYEAQEKKRTRLVEDIERTRAQAESVERTVRRGLGADKIRRYAKKVARKATARERRLQRQMLSAAWIAAPQTRPVLALAFPPTVAEGEVVVKVSGLTVPGRLAPTDLEIRAGDRVLVSGVNGAGKTTLLQALLGEALAPGGASPADPRRPAPRHDRAGLLPLPGTDVRRRRRGDPGRVTAGRRPAAGQPLGR
jgi:hypothetical protein